MADFTNRYTEEGIPGAIASGVITSHTPGRKIAKAITELQELVVVDIDADVSSPLEDNGSAIEENTLLLKLKIAGVTDTVTVLQESSGSLVTSQITFKSGVVTAISSGGSVQLGDTLPAGGEPGMVLTRTLSSQDELGVTWDWVRAVSLGD
jgi:hypothetical protein